MATIPGSWYKRYVGLYVGGPKICTSLQDFLLWREGFVTSLRTSCAHGIHALCYYLTTLQDVAHRRGSAPPAFSNSDIQFMGNSSMQSPTMTRNLLSNSGLSSPGIVSPGLMLGLSPDMGQFSVSGRSGMGSMVDPSLLPGPPLQTQFDSMNQMALPHPGSTLSGGMMMNQQMSNNFGNNMGTSGMMSPQHLQMQNQINVQQAAMSQLNQQLQHQQQQMSSNQSDFAELQMLQNKLASMRQSLNSQSLAQQNMFQSPNQSQFEPNAMDHMPPPPPVQSAQSPRQHNIHGSDHNNPILSSSTPTKQQQTETKRRVDTLPGNNPRRMTPPSLLKREDSMKMDKVFDGVSPQSTKKKYDGNGSSAHMSAMSLSIGDMQDEGNLSAVFDSSLRISQEKVTVPKEKLKDRPSNGSWDPNSLEMSVNTIGTGAGMSEAGAMSYATFGDPNLHESDGNMSFGKVFEDPDKD
jgi:hypothetical protein